MDPDQPAERNGYVLAAASPVCVVSTSDVGFDAGVVPVVEVDVVDVSGFSDAPVSDVDRVAPLRSGNTAYVIFTSGVDGSAEGCGGQSSQCGQSGVVVGGALCGVGF